MAKINKLTENLNKLDDTYNDFYIRYNELKYAINKLIKDSGNNSIDIYASEKDMIASIVYNIQLNVDQSYLTINNVNNFDLSVELDDDLIQLFFEIEINNVSFLIKKETKDLAGVRVHFCAGIVIGIYKSNYKEIYFDFENVNENIWYHKNFVNEFKKLIEGKKFEIKNMPDKISKLLVFI